jgi:hypothetical protein
MLMNPMGGIPVGAVPSGATEMVSWFMTMI